MINVKQVENKDYDELLSMYHNFYQNLLGPSWFDKIPIKKVRELLDFNKQNAIYATNKAFDSKAPKNMFEQKVLGLYDDESILGFTCLGIFDDYTGGIYHIYVKPEYRNKFIGNFKNNKLAALHLLDGIEEYFDKQSVDTVELEVPHSLNSLKLVVEKLGYTKTQDYNDTTKYVRVK